MTARKLSEFPPAYLKDMRDRADQNVRDVLATWGNPELPEEDMETLRLASLILVVMSPWRLL